MEQTFFSDEHEQQIKQDNAIVDDNQLNSNLSLIMPAHQLTQKKYSLEPDMINGWKPKKQPLPPLSVFSIKYDNHQLDYLVVQLQKKSKTKRKQIVIYLGDRPCNSYILHENIKKSNPQYRNPYPLNKKNLLKLNQRNFVGMNPKLIFNQSLIFDSLFQSGNLDTVIKVEQNQYDLFMRVDTNTQGHTNWFNFIVKNKNKCGKIKFNICNFKKRKSLYQRGMKPYVYSKKLFQKDKISWRQFGQNVSYSQTKWRYNDIIEIDQSDQKWKSTFVLSFTYEFVYENDQTQFAYCIPYTYTNLMIMLKNLEQLPFVKIKYLWKSLTGIDIPILTITDQSISSHEKKIIAISSRIHPGESNSSIVLEGFLKYLCNDNENSKYIRKKVIFIIIPMINPDGVIAGNYRTSLFGKDLNRSFQQEKKHAFPQSCYLRQYIFQLKKIYTNKFNMYIDLHGHSVKKNAFIYGPEYSITQNNYYECRLLPKIISNITSMFRYYSCIFKISCYKDTTARAIFNRQLSIINCFTIQTSNGFYYDYDKKIQLCFNGQTWQSMGISLCKSIQKLINLMMQKLKISKIRYIQKIDISANHIYEINKKSILLQEQPQKLNKGEKLYRRLQHQESQHLNFEQLLNEQEKKSDDYISQGGSDSQSKKQDLDYTQLSVLQKQICSSIKQKSERIQNAQLLTKDLQNYRIKSKEVIPKKTFDRYLMYSEKSQDIESSLIINKKNKLSKMLPPLNFHKFRLANLAKKSRKKDNVDHSKLLHEEQQNLNMSTDVKSLNKNLIRSISGMLIHFEDPTLKLNENVMLAKKQSTLTNRLKGRSVTKQNKIINSLLQNRFQK